MNVTAFSRNINKAYHISQRYQYRWVNVVASSVISDTKNFQEKLVNFKVEQQKQKKSSDEEMLVCNDQDDIGMTSFLAHTMDNADVIYFYVFFVCLKIFCIFFLLLF